MSHWPTIEQLKASPVAGRNKHLFDKTKPKKSKYNNQRIEFDGYVFDSLKESRRYLELKTLQIVGEINFLEVHPVFELYVCKYFADFSYYKDGLLVVEDVKSKMTRRLSTYRLKKKLMKQERGIEIIEL